MNAATNNAIVFCETAEDLKAGLLRQNNKLVSCSKNWKNQVRLAA